MVQLLWGKPHEKYGSQLVFVKLYSFQGYEFELPLLCIEIYSTIVLQDVQHLSGRLYCMQLYVLLAKITIDG